VLKSLAETFGVGRYDERFECLTGDQLIVTAYVATELLTLLAFAAIAFCLWRHRFDHAFKLSLTERTIMAVLLGMVALSNLLDIVLIFLSVYRLDVVMRGLVAGASIAVAISVTRRCIHPARG
jgi:hypothetical protein